ncbi:MAG: efflux RND transporter periplasmic adaptor subunit [Burkholderiales bacterium]|nr:MAG: efflux RND transporter periplasmic adaptor subunit [Burkholderiales bacterium]
MSARLLRRILLALLILGLIVLALWWTGRPQPVAVLVKPVDRGKVETTLSNTRAGTVEACQRTRLSTIIGGRIEKLTVREGDRVKKGQLLLKLWDDDRQAQSRLALTQIDSARRHAAQACTVAANAEREARRQAELRQQGFVSSSREEAARTEAEAQRAGCDAAQAEIRQAEARLAVTRVEQGRTVLYAPFDGTVAKIVGEVGEYSTPSPPGVPTPPAIDLIDASCLYVKAPMDEVDAPRIRPGQTARVSLDAYPKTAFPAKVRRVAPYVTTVEKQARTVEVEADFERPEGVGQLLVGFSADLEIVLETRENTLRIPTSALQEGGRVLVAGADGRLAERRVKAGIANWEFTEVLEGLQAGDQVVTSLEREGVKAGALYRLEESGDKVK